MPSHFINHIATKCQHLSKFSSNLIHDQTSNPRVSPDADTPAPGNYITNVQCTVQMYTVQYKCKLYRLWLGWEMIWCDKWECSYERCVSAKWLDAVLVWPGVISPSPSTPLGAVSQCLQSLPLCIWDCVTGYTEGLQQASLSILTSLLIITVNNFFRSCPKLSSI